MNRKLLIIVAYLVLLLNTRNTWAQGTQIQTLDVGAYSNGLLYDDVCVDHFGNIYILEEDPSIVKKIDALTGVITVVAGNYVITCAGDGGPATDASLRMPRGVCVDGAGNIFIADSHCGLIRKVTTDGNISTVATGMCAPHGLESDKYGNIYIGDDCGGFIRKLTPTGILTVIAGGGSDNYTVDSVLGTTLSFSSTSHLSIDTSGNVFFSCYDSNSCFKLTSDGLIYKIASIPHPTGVTADIYGNVYIATGSKIIRKHLSSGSIDTVCDLPDSQGAIYVDVTGNIYDLTSGSAYLITPSPLATYEADSFSIYVNRLCAGPRLTLSFHHYSSAYTQKTFWGDGAVDSSDILPGVDGITAFSILNHTYAYSGTYSLKTIMYNGGVPVDSILYTYEYTRCTTLPLTFYGDVNGDCVKNASECFNTIPIKIAIDSNDISIDTITCTSGLYYSALGAPGDIYSFHVIISTPGELSVTCPASGIIYDTLVAEMSSLEPQNVGLQCTGGSTTVDLSVNTTVFGTGIHYQAGDIHVQNLKCTPTEARVTLHYSPKYIAIAESCCSMTPSSCTDSTIAWNLSGISSLTSGVNLSYSLSNHFGYLTIGDTVHTYVSIVSVGTVDSNTANNSNIIIDTVRSGYDPNEMWVSPAGYVMSGTSLQYTIEFENTGNDTAHNIYVLDTLSDNVDPRTLSIVSSSAIMNIGVVNTGGHNVVKFDFPYINLLDSSHHNACTGTVTFTVNTRNGLPNCTNVFNRAGIYFDVNPVVMTNMVQNIIGPLPDAGTISGLPSVCPGSSITLTETVGSGTWSASNSNATVSTSGVVTGISSGLVIISYTTAAACGPISAMDFLHIGTDPGYITTSPGICLGSSAILGATIAGGVWSDYNGNIALGGGIMTGILPGSDTLYYTVSDACGSGITKQVINIDTIIDPGIISSSPVVCAGVTTTLAPSVEGGVWSSSNTNVTVISGLVLGVTAGLSTISYAFTNACGTFVAATDIDVLPQPYAGIITGPLYACVGSSITLTDTAAGGVWTSTNAHATVSGAVINGVTPGIDSIVYTVTNTCGSASQVYVLNVLSVAGCDSAAGVEHVYVTLGNLNIFPNPTTGALIVEMKDQHYSFCSITTTVGQIVMRKQLTTKRTELDISNLLPGVYYLTLHGNAETIVRKVVKE